MRRRNDPARSAGFRDFPRAESTLVDSALARDTSWRRILVLASAVGFFEALLFAALAPLLPDLEERLGLSKTGAGFLTSAYAAGAFAGALPSIWLARRLGVKATVITGLLVFALATAAFTAPEEAVFVFAARIGQGIGSAFAYTGALAWLTAVTPPERRGAAIGITFSATFSGEFFGPLIGAAAASVGIALVFSVITALALLLAGGAALLTQPESTAPRVPSVRALARDPVVLLAGWLIALTALLLGMLGVLGPLRLDELGWGAAAIGAVFALAALLQAAVNPVIGRMADTRGEAPPLRLGLLVSALTSVLLLADDRALVYGAIVIAAATAYATLWTPALARLSGTVEQRGFDQALVFGLMSAAWPPGFAIGAAAGGALAAATTDAWPYVIAAVACLLSLPLLGPMAATASSAEDR
jgi:MFS family permease